MRKSIITGALGMFALITIGGYFLMPSSKTDRCFQQIKIGMSGIEAQKILEEHQFGMSSYYDDKGIYFTNLSERMSISISYALDDDFTIVSKEIVPLESFMERAWRYIFDSVGNDNRDGSDVSTPPPEEGRPWTLQNEDVPVG